MKLINKDNLLKYLLNKRDCMYRRYDRLNRAIDNDCINLDRKLNEQSQISFGIDIITEFIEMLNNYAFDLCEIKQNDIVVFNLSESKKDIQEAFTNTYEYFSNHGISAVAMFNNDKSMELDEKRKMIDYIVKLLDDLKGEN